MEQVMKQNLRKPLIANNVFGMMVFVITEIMFFTALISSYLVIRKDRGAWELPEGIQLPISMTAFNTLLLFLSGALLFYASHLYSENKIQKTKKALLISTLLGFCFVCIQSYEWTQLIAYGFSIKSNIFGALFFLIIGSHALHALAGVFALIYTTTLLKNNQIGKDGFHTILIFWSFIVGVWPVLYYLVYFN